MASIVFYHNAKAGKGGVPYSEAELRKFFFRHDMRFRRPSSRDELLENLDVDLEGGVDYIFSVGGDGTANTIAQKLLHRDTRLMVIPSGTANDFASGLGLSPNIKKIAQVFHAQQTRLVDVITVNGRAMVSNGGIGIAADVAAEVNQKRMNNPLFKTMMRTLGKDTYGFMLMQHLVTRPLPLYPVRIESPDAPGLDEVASPLILVNNQAMLGGKFRVAPNTRNDDGTFNVTVFLHRDKTRFIQTVARVLRAGVPDNDPQIVTFETNRLRLTPLTLKPMDFFGDGEQFQTAESYEVEIVPRALRACAMDQHTLFCAGYGLEEIPKLQ